MAELTDEEAQAAKRELEAALTAYYAVVEPGTYVGAYVLVTHKETIALERANQSAVGILEKTGQPWPMTRGLLDVAVTSHRRGWEQE